MKTLPPSNNGLWSSGCSAAWKIALGYAIFGSVWIVGSDRALEWLVPDSDSRASWEVIKGSFYVLMTAMLLGITLDRYLRRLYKVIDERRWVEEALQNNRAQLHAALASMTDAFFACDLQERVFEMNEAFARFHRFVSLAHCPLVLPDLRKYLEWRTLSGEIVPVEQRPHIRAFAGEACANAEYRLSRIDTGEVWIASYSFAPIRDSKGKIIGAVVIGRDVTEIKKSEEQIRLLNTALEQRVAERTAQLEAANNELEAFSYSVSHDLRAPLRAVIGFATILGEEHAAQIDPEGQRLLGTIRSAATRMNALIDDLLSFARMGRRQMESSTIDMEALVGTVYADCVVQARGRRIEFQAYALAPAIGDSAMMQQVLTNLISNAIKYTRPRDVARIEISSRAGEKETIYWVRDNGVGFDMQYAQRLFGVFQRLHSDDQFEGTGVGLALVARIISRHGGRVWAESTPNEGACFFFTLPNPKGLQ